MRAIIWLLKMCMKSMHPQWVKERNIGRNANRNHQNRRGEGMGGTSNGMVKRCFGIVDFICLCLPISHLIYVDTHTSGFYVDTLFCRHRIHSEQLNVNNRKQTSRALDPPQ